LVVFRRKRLLRIGDRCSLSGRQRLLAEIAEHCREIAEKAWLRLGLAGVRKTSLSDSSL